MKRLFAVVVLCLAGASPLSARGLLIPVEPDLPPLALLNHRVTVVIEDQVAVTKIEQTFRNHTDRRLEANYVFPVPKGASVREFAMWSNGQRMKGELLPAEQAKSMYTSIVRQTKNPAMLDYIGSDLLSLKIFPIPPNGDQKVELSFTAIARKERDLVEYVYPLKTDRAAASTLEEFRLDLTLKSQQPIGGIYSPSHEVAIRQLGDHEAVVQYERSGVPLDRDFQLFYTSSGQDIGLTALQQRPISTDDGYVLLLVSPRAELSKDQKVPRDIVFVVDTSGSMSENKKMDQAKQALRHCLGGLTPDDRFGLISFATTVERYRPELAPATDEHVKRAKGWVADLYPGGGTAIHDALRTALEMRTSDAGRMFTVVFFTDGQPTIGERSSDKILADIGQRNTANTRIFSFGVGTDLNAVLLDQLAEQTRAVSRYVHPGENFDTKVASFFDTIHHPVLANLRLVTSGDVQLREIYPPRLPDLFHGDQLVVLARFQGTGKATVKLEGKVGVHDKQFVHELNFAGQSEGKPFVEELWARRKVGYLLDQIRVNGEQKELVDEVVRLAKSYGITTPYTSYLIMPDGPVQLAANEGPGVLGKLARRDAPAALAPGGFGGAGGLPTGKTVPLADFAKQVQREKGELARNRGLFQDKEFEKLDSTVASRPTTSATKPAAEAQQRLAEAKKLKGSLDMAYGNYQRGQWRQNQVSAVGVDLAVCTNQLKCQSQVSANAIRRVNNRTCMEIGGVWIDEAFTAQTPTLSIKAQSDAYFRLLEQQPQMREVLGLGNHVVWIAPNGTALVIDTEGKDKLTDGEIRGLFAVK